jgi:hypothetical protein
MVGRQCLRRRLLRHYRPGLQVLALEWAVGVGERLGAEILVRPAKNDQGMQTGGQLRPSFSTRFLMGNPRGSFTANKIKAELGPLGGTDPLEFAMDNKSPGIVSQAYRSYLANRIRQGRLDNSFLSISAKLRPLESQGGKYFLRRDMLESAAQQLLERISRF